MWPLGSTIYFYLLNNIEYCPKNRIYCSFKVYHIFMCISHPFRNKFLTQKMHLDLYIGITKLKNGSSERFHRQLQNYQLYTTMCKQNPSSVLQFIFVNIQAVLFAKMIVLTTLTVQPNGVNCAFASGKMSCITCLGLANFNWLLVKL